jgi:subtilisin family serine protease
VVRGHGSGIAGIIASPNVEGIQGVTPGAKIWPMKVCGQMNLDGRLIWACTAPTVVDAICQVSAAPAATRPHVINLSLGSLIPDYIVRRAIQDANAAGVLVVAAAGNSGDSILPAPPNPIEALGIPRNTRMYPAAFAENGNAPSSEGPITGLISVTASNQQDKRFDYATHNSAVTLAAPGENVTTLNSVTNQPQEVDGTSYATAYVSGAAAMWVAAYKRKFPVQPPLPTPNVIKQRLQSSTNGSVNGCTDCGLGIINIPEVIRNVP